MYSAKRLVALVLSLVLILMLLTSCGSDTKKDETDTTVTFTTVTPEITVAPSNDINEAEPVSNESSGAVDSLTSEQKNSLNMLNYLAFITQEILAKKNNRVFIEQIYTSLLNDINPSILFESIGQFCKYTAVNHF